MAKVSEFGSFYLTLPKLPCGVTRETAPFTHGARGLVTDLMPAELAALGWRVLQVEDSIHRQVLVYITREVEVEVAEPLAIEYASVVEQPKPEPDVASVMKLLESVFPEAYAAHVRRNERPVTDAECCHKTRVRGASCPIGLKCPYVTTDAERAAVGDVSG